MKRQEHIIFREVQRPRQIWIWVIILLIAAFMWFSFITQVIIGVPIGDKPAPDIIMLLFWLAFSIVFPLCLLRFMKLVTEVRRDGLYVRYVPFHFHYKSFLFKDIVRYKNITYRPLGRFGGWGIRFNAEGETAYTMSGNQGIELHLPNSTVVVGSQDPDGLIKALDSAKRDLMRL
ncbi:hypothetical protein WQ54_21780 [Bacillus sp. SA1-12]|uniref:DUF6141 family protein n=1 Tax=Bacillus sp. SA1-12 TaxID=1455638 RepID=UPI000626F338|nr:DUF6141 family protein [Bacillus sp. SA1-12]KKI90560.1 hypothetical protein WQ54_21780 [Bacillus sp. SA1-12]